MEPFKDDHEIPDIDDIVVTRNNEDYFVSPEEDWEEKTRPAVSLSSCPFGPCRHPETGVEVDSCSKSAWSSANVWSLQGATEALGYLMHHGIYSPWHGMRRQECYDFLKDNWKDLKWEIYDDTFHMRQSYRDYREREKNRRGHEKKRAEQVDRWKSKGNGTKRKNEDRTEDMVSRKDVSEIVSQALQEFYQAGDGGTGGSSSASESPWAKIQSVPKQPIAAQNSSFDLTAGSGAGTRTNTCGFVTIPMEKLKFMQAALQRAEHAISSSLSHTVEQSNKLAHERLMVLNAVEVISSISGVKTSHFGHFG